MGNAIYKLVDGKGRVLIPKALREAANLEYGGIVGLGLADGKVTVRRVDVIEPGDQSPEAVEAYVHAALKTMPDSTRLKLLAELSGLLQKRRHSAMREYTKNDCGQTGYGISLKGKVVVLNRAALPPEHPGQLFLCTGGNGANPNPMGRSVFLVSLSNGESCRFWREDVAGTLKPELLSDEAKLMLSQVRPIGAKNPARNEPEYSGYSFLPDGRYSAGVWLCSPQEALDYVEMQKPYQHRVLVCDRDDFAVLEVIDGELIYPDEQALAAFRQGQGGGMKME